MPDGEGLEATLLRAIAASEERLLSRMSSQEAMLRQLKKDVVALATETVEQRSSCKDRGAKAGRDRTAARRLSAGNTLSPAVLPPPSTASTDSSPRMASTASSALEQGTHRKDKEHMWALVKADQQVLSALTDARRQMDSYATKRLKREGSDDDGEEVGAERVSGRQVAGNPVNVIGNFSRRAKEGVADSAKRLKSTASSSRLARVLKGIREIVHRRCLHVGPVDRLRQDGCCRFICGKVIHPESRFRTVWNVMLAVFICYCGIAVPLEIAFETDMVASMCGTGETRQMRAQCASFQVWFWCNFVIDMWFISDIIVNFRTGYVVEGYFEDNDRKAAWHYLRGSFFMDCLGSFPLNLLLMAITPDNPYGDVVEGEEGGADVGRINRMLRLIRMAKLAKPSMFVGGVAGAYLSALHLIYWSAPSFDHARARDGSLMDLTVVAPYTVLQNMKDDCDIVSAAATTVASRLT